MKKTILFAAVSTLALGVNAGDWGKSPVGKAPIEECIDLGGEISVGWMSEYYFKGMQFANSSVWTDVNYTFDGLAVPVTVGAWYMNAIDQYSIFRPFGDQLDLYANAALGTFAGFDVNIGYTHHFYPELGASPFPGARSFGEIGLDLRRNLGFVDFVAETSYLLNDIGWYHQIGLEKTIAVTDSISLVLAGGLGYTDRLFIPQGGVNHYYLRAALPIQLNCRTVLTPYVGYHFSETDRLFLTTIPAEIFADSFHGGVSLSVSF